MLTPCGAEEVEKAAERFRHIVADTPIQLGPDPHRALTVTLSLGTASTSGYAHPRLEELIKRADDALYQSKGSGRNRVTIG